MNKGWKTKKRLIGKSGDLFLTRRSGTLRRARVDAIGKTRYVGITSRETAIRVAEHAASSTAKAGLSYEPVATGLSRIDARIWEQNLINQFGLQKNGGQLFNQINSIAPKYWWQYGIYPQ